MAKVVRNKLDKKTTDSLWREFWERIQNLRSLGDLRDFLHKFFTKDEKILILRRLALMRLVRGNKKYREIKDMLDVSATTISAVKSMLKGGKYREK